MYEFLAVALGGAVGGVLRYWVTTGVNRLTGDRFPWATLLVNTSGALLAGLAFAVFTTSSQPHTTMTLLVVTGFCGSYTTVSSLALQTLQLIRGGHHGAALTNILMTLALGFAVVWLGVVAGRYLSGAGA